MPATDILFGIRRLAGSYIDKVNTKAKVKVVERADSDGVTKRVHPFDPQTDFSIQGGGVATLAVGVGVSGINGLGGGVQIIKEVEQNDTNDNFQDYTVTGTHYPNAQDA